MNSEAKNSPPRKPKDSETTDAENFRARTSSSATIVVCCARYRVMAPWPDDRTAGANQAIGIRQQPPITGRHKSAIGTLRVRLSATATRRISAMPVPAATAPSKA